MAIYHCQVKPVSRAKGQSSTAGAAYRSCSKVRDERTGELHDYTRKRGLEHSEIVLSQKAAKQDIQWARDRHQLWNAAEAAEVRKDARVAREYELALPHELTKEQRLELSRAFAQDLANRYQCAVDVAIHKPHRHGDQRNHHAHLYATTRQVIATGLGAKTYIERSDTDRAKLGLPSGKVEITTIRERWAEAANKALEAANRKERVDHRSLEAQGIDRAPTYHKGPAILGIGARGRKSRVVERIEAAEAGKRHAKAAEVGRVLEVSRRLRTSAIELERNVGAALRSREAKQGAEALRAPDAAARPEPKKKLSLEELQKKAAENWLKYRERAKSAGATPGKNHEPDRALGTERGRSKGKDRGGPDDDFSL